MNYSKSLGFTLIEMLVATSIIITSTTIVVSILASSFRSVDKTSVSEDLRQSGNSAIGRMSRHIQFADSFQGVSDDGSFYYNDCTGSASIDYSFVKVRSSGQIDTLSCLDLSITNESEAPISLIDTNKLTVTNCKFTCSQGDNSPPIISISFDLSRRNAPAGEEPVSFSTSAKMRNQ